MDMDLTAAQKAAREKAAREEALIETCVRNWEIAYQYLTYLPLQKLVTVPTIIPTLFESAKACARRDFKHLNIDPRYFEWLGQSLEPFCQLFKGDVLQTLTLTFYLENRVPNCAEAARRIIRESTKLTTIHFIDWPNRSDITLEVPQTVSTVSFIAIHSFLHVYNKLNQFHNLQNVNFFQFEFGRGDTNIHLLTQWLETHPVTNSVWLPDRCHFNLEIIRQVLTVRLRVHSSSGNFSNLHSLENLTRLRIEAFDDQPSTELTLQLLKEYGDLNGQKLIELHLSCDFNTRPLPEILLMFINLQKLIIVHNDFMRVPLGENLQWPQNLKDLKCCNFIICKAKFEELVGREHLRRLDINHSDFSEDVTNGGLKFRRSNDYQILEILLTYAHGPTMFDGIQEKYLTYGKVKILNSNLNPFFISDQLGINIEFVGLEDPWYWAHLKF